MKENKTLLDKVEGCLIGFAIGDALGAPVEFKKFSLEISDFIPAYSKGLKEGQYTDDTEQLLIGLNSLLENAGKVDIDDIAKKLMYWYTHKPRSIGHTTENAIKNLLKGVPPNKSGIDNPRSCGSAAIPRILPFCLYSSLVPSSKKISNNDIRNILGITHSNKKVFCMGELLNYYIQEMIYGKNAFSTTLQIVSENNFLNKKIRKKLESILATLEDQKNINPINEIKKIGDSGYVEDVVYSSLFCVMYGKDFQESVLYAVNGGGDSDSRGAITGALSGLQFGYSNIPNKWRETVEGAELLKKSAEDLIKLAFFNV